MDRGYIKSLKLGVLYQEFEVRSFLRVKNIKG